MKTIYEHAAQSNFTSFLQKSLLLCAYFFPLRYGKINVAAKRRKNREKQSDYPPVAGAAAVTADGCPAFSAAGMRQYSAITHRKNDPATQEGTALPAEDGAYSTPKEVAEYLHIYGQLPQNYLTKQQAKALGWSASEGNLWEVAEDMSIGGDRFGNREGCLPEVEGRVWYECDVNYAGGFRGAKRLLYSNDGLIYYTNDHYESFTPIYGEEETP